MLKIISLPEDERGKRLISLLKATDEKAIAAAEGRKGALLCPPKGKTQTATENTQAIIFTYKGTDEGRRRAIISAEERKESSEAKLLFKISFMKIHSLKKQVITLVKS